MEEAIPQDIVELLRDRVGSVEKLEALLLLHRESAQVWTLAETARQLSLPESLLEPELDALVDAGLFARTGRGLDVSWKYAPRDVASGELVARLAAIYPVRRLEVLRLLNDLALQRIRGSAARAFADAFVIGRRKKDG